MDLDALPDRHLLSLEQAVMLTDTDRAPRRVVVLSVEVRHAQPMLDIISSGIEKYNWITVDGNLGRLHQVSRLHLKLVIVNDVIIPLLVSDPTHQAASRLLLKMGWAVRHIARNVDFPHGDLYRAASSTGNLLRRHGAHIHKGTRQIDWLTGNIPVLRARIQELITMTVLIPADDEEAGGQEGGAGHE
ncbi:uncharacterized protein [Lolium perenne]|uniref:uncharacterized protein n=1 Tax=Lolium perenne TaxID=4522 RepID=UPI0021F5EF5E|nr:uncharacterized protein LOC127338200 [Lolium perenne]